MTIDFGDVEVGEPVERSIKLPAEYQGRIESLTPSCGRCLFLEYKPKTNDLTVVLRALSHKKLPKPHKTTGVIYFEGKGFKEVIRVTYSIL